MEYVLRFRKPRFSRVVFSALTAAPGNTHATQIHLKWALQGLQGETRKGFVLGMLSIDGGAKCMNMEEVCVHRRMK